MTAPICWFRFEKDVPGMSAAEGDLFMLNTDTGRVWVWSDRGRYIDLKHEYLRALSAIDLSRASKPSHPITAPNDEAALIELIRLAGGRMPEA